MSAHARLGPSAAHRWLACPGSVNLAATVPNPSGPHAAEGTFAHGYAAYLLDKALGNPHDAGAEWAVPDEMKGHVQKYVDYCLGWGGPRTVRYVEIKLFDALKCVDQDTGGTSDFVAYDPDTRALLVPDFKYGAGVFVEVEANPQLMLYALGARQLINAPVDSITLAVVQPRAEDAEGRAVREWTAPASVLIDFAADVKAAADASRRPDAPLVPGEKQCRWCPAKHICPALTEQTHALVAAEFEPVAQYDPAKLRQALDMIPMVEARIKALRDFAYAELAHGRAVPGYKLVEKRATRKWADEDSAGAKLVAEFGTDVFEKPALKSPAQVEKAVGKKAFAPYADLAPAVSSGYTLVPESDKRAPVTAIQVTDFPALGGTAEE